MVTMIRTSLNVPKILDVDIVSTNFLSVTVLVHSSMVDPSGQDSSLLFYISI